MWPWLDLLTNCLIAFLVGGSILGVAIIAHALVGDWLRARGWDPEFRCEVREWEEEMGRRLTQVEREALAQYRVS
jgi:hypothetical protein